MVASSGQRSADNVAFLAVVLIFHVWLAKEPDAFVNALWGGAFLSGIALSVACC